MLDGGGGRTKRGRRAGAATGAATGAAAPSASDRRSTAALEEEDGNGLPSSGGVFTEFQWLELVELFFFVKKNGRVFSFVFVFSCFLCSFFSLSVVRSRSLGSTTKHISLATTRLPRSNFCFKVFGHIFGSNMTLQTRFLRPKCVAVDDESSSTSSSGMFDSISLKENWQHHVTKRKWQLDKAHSTSTQ